jgi:RNA ligase (TIGR02306 family)
MRKLASIRKISAISPIEGADAIELAVVDGWKIVVKKGEFGVGDLAVYCEIDSWIPHELAPFLSRGQAPREYSGVKGERLRTVRLRGQLSQGLLLPLAVAKNGLVPLEEGDDVTEMLGIQKWEAVIPAQLAGSVRGNFPSFIRKTDQERCQNFLTQIFIDNRESQYEVTVKLDGSSCTIYHRDGELGVCSRNLELKIDEENRNNSLVGMFYKYNLGDSLVRIGRNIALQGEIMGPGVQGNREALKECKFFIYDIYDIDAGEYLNPTERHEVLSLLRSHGSAEIEHVPVLHSNTTLEELGISCIEHLLDFAEGPSLVNAVREGLVFKRADGKFSFKAISNKFLLKGGE